MDYLNWPMALHMVMLPSIMRTSLHEISARLKISAFMVGRTVSYCNSGCYVTGQLIAMITDTILLVAQTGFSIASCKCIWAKSALRKLWIFRFLRRIHYQFSISISFQLVTKLHDGRHKYKIGKKIHIVTLLIL